MQTGTPKLCTKHCIINLCIFHMTENKLWTYTEEWYLPKLFRTQLLESRNNTSSCSQLCKGMSPQAIHIVTYEWDIAARWPVAMAINSNSTPPTHLTAGRFLCINRWLALSSKPHWQITRVAPTSYRIYVNSYWAKQTHWMTQIRLNAWYTHNTLFCSCKGKYFKVFETFTIKQLSTNENWAM